MEFEAERRQLGPLTVRVLGDDMPGESPREWCPFGTFYTDHPDYISPDEWPRRYHSVTYQVAADLGIRPAPERDRDGRFIQHDTFEDNPARMIEKARKAGHIVLPVWLYDHSGRTYQAAESNPFTCRWDSGCVGFVFASADTIRREFGVKRITRAIRAKAENLLKQEVDTWSHWAGGDVWGYVVEDEHGDTQDSCWGFIGGSEEIAYCLLEGVESARAILAERRRARMNKLKSLIRARAPLGARAEILA